MKLRPIKPVMIKTLGKKILENLLLSRGIIKKKSSWTKSKIVINTKKSPQAKPYLLSLLFTTLEIFTSLAFITTLLSLFNPLTVFFELTKNVNHRDLTIRVTFAIPAMFTYFLGSIRLIAFVFTGCQQEAHILNHLKPKSFI